MHAFHRAPPAARLSRHSARRGLTLLEVIVVLLAMLTTGVLVYCLGLVGALLLFLGAILFLAGTLAFSCGCVYCPRLTRNVTAVLFIAFLAFALLPPMLMKTRERARRHTAVNNMKRIGRNLQEDALNRGHFPTTGGEELPAESTEDDERVAAP